MSFAQKIKNFFSQNSIKNAEIFEDFADLLIESDFGPKNAFEICNELEKTCKNRNISSRDEILDELKKIISPMVKSYKFQFQEDKTNVILVLGINGVGKTTSVAKMASYFGQFFLPKNKIVLAAADTYRAAAIDQLKFHGEKTGIRVVAHQGGSDPGAVVFDAAEAVKANGGGLVIADTAGRLHNKENLVRELKKIDKIAESKADPGCIRRIIVLDCTTGQNALRQVEAFGEVIDIDGVFLTKYDSTAKGGVVASLGKTFGLPVCFLGTGENYGDIEVFSEETYVKNLFE